MGLYEKAQYFNKILVYSLDLLCGLNFCPFVLVIYSVDANVCPFAVVIICFMD
jgi:hypothetical protein